MSAPAVDRLNEALRGRYRIERELGAGGMATVYLADDLRHGRKVALKVLRPELSAVIGGDRFLAEIRTTANLQHPHILPLHDSGAVDGLLFYVMPFVEGESLKERLDREDTLEPGEAVRLAASIAQALQHAHARGVVHRDIKPANILLQDGEPLVADFGIALALAPDAPTRLTATGMAVGTVAYMSPEQATGAPDVDGRSDVYAMGCLLYEMLTGSAPFAGGTPQAMLARKVVGTLPDGMARDGGIPPTLGDVIERAMAPDAASRFQTAKDLADALARALDAETVRVRAAKSRRTRLARVGMLSLAVAVAAVGTTWALRSLASPDVERLAVLPPTSLVNAPDQEPLLQGIQGALVNELSRAGVDVIGGVQSMMRYRGSTQTVREIAREIDVDALLESSVFWAGDSVGIDVRLLDADTEGPLWTGSYVEATGNILALYRRVTTAIAGEIRVALTPAAAARLAAARPLNPEAYRAYLRAQFHWNRLTPEDLEVAVQFLEEALEIDPAYAEAYAGLAWVRVAQQQLGILAPSVATPLADSAAARAMALDDQIPESHYASGSVGWATWDWARAEAGYREAIELDPNFALARGDYAHYLSVMQRHDEAAAQIDRALEIDPFNLQLRGFRAVMLAIRGAHEEALEEFRQIVAQAPNMTLAWNGIYVSSAHLGREDDAVEAAEVVMRRRGFASVADTLIAAYGRMEYREAIGAAADELRRISEERFVAPMEIARLYSGAGRMEEALDWLERGVEAREPNSPYIGVAEDFVPFRDEPRFRALRERMGLPQ